jgi:hypothetical protein
VLSASVALAIVGGLHVPAFQVCGPPFGGFTEVDVPLDPADSVTDQRTSRKPRRRSEELGAVARLLADIRPGADRVTATASNWRGRRRCEKAVASVDRKFQRSAMMSP